MCQQQPLAFHLSSESWDVPVSFLISHPLVTSVRLCLHRGFDGSTIIRTSQALSWTEADLSPLETNFPSSQTPASFLSRSAGRKERSETGLVGNALSALRGRASLFFRGGKACLALPGCQYMWANWQAQLELKSFLVRKKLCQKWSRFLKSNAYFCLIWFFFWHLFTQRNDFPGGVSTEVKTPPLLWLT